MGRSSINFVFGPSALGQAAQGNDFIRGLNLYGTAPGSFATTPTQAVYSVQDGVNKGIANDYADETQAIGIVTLSGTITAGDTVTIKVTEPLANGGAVVINLGTATAPATPTATTFAAAVIAAINANSYQTGANINGTQFNGYTATNTAGAIYITARVGSGISLNTGTPIAVTVTGTTTATITQQFGTGSGGATTGVFSNKSLWYYHVSEFFRANANGVLWVCFQSSPNQGGAYNEITTLQAASQGACKAIGVYNIVARSVSQIVSDLGLMNAQASTLMTNYMPTDVFYAPNIAAVSNLATLGNGQAQTYQYCSVNIGQDGAAWGADLYVRTGVSVSTIGCMLGTSSQAAPSQDIGENIFNVSDGVELNIPAFSNGQLYGALSNTLVNQIDSYHYIFLLNYTNYAGTYFNDDWSFVSNTSDYNRISRNLVMNKVVRVLYAALLPLLKSRIYLNTDGTMTAVTKTKYLNPANEAVGQIQKDGDISNYSIVIPSQNVLSTSKIVLTVQIQPVGIAETIEVDLSFAQTV